MGRSLNRIASLGQSYVDQTFQEACGEELLRWFNGSKRDLPWRHTKDPYAIWVSEVMLQQTQTSTVIAYWERWMNRFPTVQSLAAADELEVLSLWQGLGYYRRCRSMLQAAREMSTAGIPDTADGWRRLSGVGPYTAAAVSSIALGHREALVDGNVERVYARVTGDTSVKDALKKSALNWASQNIHPELPGDWNQALMELGATICKPVNPVCSACPISFRCVARQSWRTELLPTRVTPPKVVSLRLRVWVPVFKGRFGLRQIPAGQWWEGMWEFPRLAFDTESDVALRELVGEGWVESVGQFRHSVTHHRISVSVEFVRCETQSPSLTWFEDPQMEALPLPAPQRKALRMVRHALGG